jgi:WD40 repeat protein
LLLSGDRQRIIVGSIDSDGTICLFDPASGATASTTGPSEFIHGLVATPDGASILTFGSQPNRVVVLDAKTLSQKTSFPVSADIASDGSLFVSPDSQTAYLSSGSQIFAYNLVSGAMTGWMPAPYVQASYSGLLVGSAELPILGAEDGTGLIAGPMEEGVGFVDTSTLRTGPVGSSFTNAYLTPATGPVSGGTATTGLGAAAGSAKITAVNFGPNAATGVSSGSTGISATSPAGAAGPVDVYSFASDGGVQIVPDAFSYGRDSGSDGG